MRYFSSQKAKAQAAAPQSVRRAGRKHKAPRGFRPRLETLEPRVMLEAETLLLHDLDMTQKDSRHVTVGIFIPSNQEADSATRKWFGWWLRMDPKESGN